MTVFIMKVLEMQEEPEPMTVMNYYPHGNIRDHRISPSRQKTAFGQLLQGLSYLHSAPWPVVAFVVIRTSL